MFGINAILNKVFSKEPLTEEERFKILHSKKIDSKVIEYLMEKLNNLYIEVLSDYEGSLFELMPVHKLEGWCWQTTESAIVFFNDDDYIERGYLLLDEREPYYYHSWICFKYKNVEYVLDPCLNFLCRKKDYFKVFEIYVKGKVSAKAVKDELIEKITFYKTNKKELMFYESSQDANTPFYRNGAGYTADIENDKIRKLKVHYYNTYI